jgi:hypothetical protein
MPEKQMKKLKKNKNIFMGIKYKLQLRSAYVKVYAEKAFIYKLCLKRKTNLVKSIIHV